MAEVSEDKADRGLANCMVFNGKPGELYLFAYGSNMNKEQIRARCANPKAIAIAKLPNHRVAFFGYSKTWDGAMETVIEAPGREVWGVIYELSFSDWDKLDAWQDVRLNGTGAYFHYPASVTDTQGKIRTVLFYKKDILGDPQKPSREYLDFIAAGALEHGLPSSHIDGLQRIESKKAEFDVPRRRNFGCELFLETNCSKCGD
jgi:gamma-glutamylcyclotransferase (GGCT)/AIG2-like uncharacterized protein YtfP